MVETIWRELTVYFIIWDCLTEQFKDTFQILSHYISLPKEQRKIISFWLRLYRFSWIFLAVHLLFSVKHGEGKNKIVFCGLCIRTRLLNYVYKLFKFEGLLAVGEVRNHSMSMTCCVAVRHISLFVLQIIRLSVLFVSPCLVTII